MSQKYYIVAGEASGDLHGSNLVAAMLRLQPDAHIRAWGGDRMSAAGAEVVKHYRDLAFMGFIEVVRNLGTILRNFRTIKADIRAYKPDALVLIDYPGFNLRLAKWAKREGIRVVYYISPQIWAWHASRAHQIRQCVDQMLVILPFEQAFYKQYGMDVQFVGHPLLDALTVPPPGMPRKKMILVMPGSRRQEVELLLPIMLANVAHFPDYQWVVAAVDSLPAALYTDTITLLGLTDKVTVAYGRTHALMCEAELGLVKSGTSTLEAALHRLPQVVCYKGSPVSYAIAKRVIRVRYISLVNLVLDRPLVAELIQADCNPENIATEMRRLLQPDHAAAVQAGYADLIEVLGTAGASERAAKWVVGSEMGG